MNKFVSVLLLLVVLLTVCSAANAEDFPPEDLTDVFIIHRPTLNIWLKGTEVIAIEFDDTMYPIGCDGYDKTKLLPCVVLGKNDSIPEFLSFIAQHGEVQEMPRMWGRGDEKYNV